MSLDIQQVENLNRKAQQLNANRQQTIGMQQAAKQAYDKAVFAYEQKYGVKLDDTNLQQEYNTVHAEVEKSFNELNQLVVSIENGEFTQQATPTITQNTAPIQTQQAQPVPQAQPVQQQANPFGAQQVNSFGAQTSQATTQVSNVEEAPKQEEQPQYRTVSPELLAQASMGAMNQQVPNIPTGAPTIPTSIPTPAPVVPSAPQQAVDPSEQPFAPQGWGTPNINQQFENINNGKPFGQ